MVQQVKPDGVYVIGQPHLMYDIWRWCLEQKLNLYIEKPLGLTIHQARSLAYLAQEHGCITQVSHQRRSAPLLRHLREACLERGPIAHGVVEFYKCAIVPELGARDHMMDDCTHSVDTARWICGGEVTAVESHCKRIEVPDINWIGATLRFDNGSSCYVINSWASGRRIFRVQMHAPTIYAEADLETRGYLYADGDYERQGVPRRRGRGERSELRLRRLSRQEPRVHRFAEERHRSDLLSVPRHGEDHGGVRDDPGPGSARGNLKPRCAARLARRARLRIGRRRASIGRISQ